MEWLASNWLWLSLLGLFVVLHFFGHRHGRHEDPVGNGTASAKTPLRGAHHGCCGGHGSHAGPHHVHAHSDHAHHEYGEHDCCGGKKKPAEKNQSDPADEPLSQAEP